MSEEFVAGRNSVAEALKGGRAINKVLVAKGERHGSIKEIIGDSLLLFDEFSIENIDNMIKKYLLNEEYRNVIIQNGLSNANKFSWDLTYQKILSIYDNCYRSK